MARTPRNEPSRARRGVSARGERRTARSPVNGLVAESIAWIQHLGTHLGALSNFLGSSSVPSSGIEVQPEMQPGCLADGLDLHQPVCMGFQPSRTDFDMFTLAEFDATQRLETIDIGTGNLQTVFPLELGNQSSARTRASRFQSGESLASVVSCGAGNPTSIALNAAPTASHYDFPAALCGGPEVVSPLPEILPLQEAEKLHMLEELFLAEQDQSVENASCLSPPKQLYQPNHSEWPMQMVNYDPPSHSHTSRSLLPLGEMIHHPATHPQSFPFGQSHQQSSRQTLTDLDEDVEKQLLGSAPFYSSPSNERCAMKYSAGYPAPPNANVITDIFPSIVEAAPTVNITPFDSLTQSPATKPLPNSTLISNRSAHSASANHSNVSKRLVTAGRNRVPRKRLPQSRQATVGRLRQIRTAPIPDASPSIINFADIMFDRIETQRQNHMQSERRKRKQMNELYATMRSCLPPTTRKIRTDNATVLLNMVNQIKTSENELKMLERQREHVEQLLAAFRDVNPSKNDMDSAAERVFTSNGYTCAEHTHPHPALTAVRAAVTTMPAVHYNSGLGSFLGTNVSINYCHDNCTVTVSSPHLGQAVALLEPVLIAIRDHHLEVVFASIFTTSNTHVYTLQCKASPDAELLRSNLHSVLEGIVDNFSSSSSSQKRHG